MVTCADATCWADLRSRDDNTPPVKLNPFLLHDMLWQKGWACKVVEGGCKRNRIKDFPPFAPGQPQVYFIQESSTKLPVAYMAALASAATILASGHIDAIPHFKAPAYYSALLATHKPLEPKRGGRKRAMCFEGEPALLSLADDPALARPMRRRRIAGPDFLDDADAAIEDGDVGDDPDPDVQSEATSGTDDDSDGSDDADIAAEEILIDGSPSDAGGAAQHADAPASPGGIHLGVGAEVSAAATGIRRVVSDNTYEWQVKGFFFRFTHVRAKASPARKARWQVFCRMHTGRCTMTKAVTVGQEAAIEAKLRQWSCEGLRSGSKAEHRARWAAVMARPMDAEVVSAKGVCFTPKEYTHLQRRLAARASSSARRPAAEVDDHASGSPISGSSSSSSSSASSTSSSGESSSTSSSSSSTSDSD